MMKKRLWAIFLSICLVVTLLPNVALAADNGVTTTATNGNCGATSTDHVTWKLEQNNVDSENPTYTLTISGTGDMANLVTLAEDLKVSQNNQPWVSAAHQITKLVIDEGITSIGDGAFYDTPKLKSADIPASVTKIGVRAFNWAETMDSLTFAKESKLKEIGYAAFNAIAISEVTIPASVEKIDKQAFGNDSNLTTVLFEQGSALKEIEENAFFKCSKLAKLTLPEGLTTIGNRAFNNENTNLAAVVIPSTVTSFGEEIYNTKNGCLYFANSEVYSRYAKPKTMTCFMAVMNGGMFASDTAFTTGTLSKPSKDGYIFAGWYENEDCSGTAVTTPTAGQTYYAKWHTPSTLSTNIGEQKFVVGEPTEFTFTTTANDDANIMVIGTSNFSDADAIEKLEYLESKDGKWYELKGDFGPSTGFPMTDATSTFRATFKKGGNYTFTVSMKKVDGGDVLCSTKVKFTVDKVSQTAPANAPTLKDRTYTSITLYTVEPNANGAAAQYSKDGGKIWQNLPEFTGLTSGTTYTFAVRYAETDTYKASPASATAEFSTLYYSSDPSYAVTAPGKTENGTVSVTPANASKGMTVTVNAKPDSGYILGSLEVKDANGNALSLTDKGNGKYTFTMPAGKVEIKAAFAKEVETSPFSDVSTDAYYYEAVKWAQEKGITEGVGDGLFGSEQPCTRGQIVTFLWRAAGSPEPKNSASTMTDLNPNNYYYKAVLWAIENGITSGVTDTTFAPDATCTRGQGVTFLYRALGATTHAANSFADVAADSFCADAVAWAVENGVTYGTSSATFSPADDCTRSQIVTFLYRAYQGK